ncbi:MAG: hypothetical protein ABIS06_07890 [Vicinamibacterales bacterium]
MVTNYPQQLVAAAEVTFERTGSVLARSVARFGQVICGVRGHDGVLHYEGKRVMMRCTSCGHDSPGWEITGRGPRKRFDGDPRRHSMDKPQLVLRKSA